MHMTDTSTAAPSVSVVMPVHNSESYLADSIGSVLGQTFTDWELICVDDGSTDGSLEVLRCYERADGRVRVVTRPNTGVTRARNDGMALARGRYIAVMDSDDIALPDRLRRQVDHMETHPECVGLGAAVRVVGPDLKPIYDEPKALDHETIDRQTMAGSGAAIREPVAIFRAAAIRQLGGYRDEIFAHQDTDIYLRLAEIGRLANLPDTLLLYRLRLGSINRTQGALQAQYGPKVIRDARIRRGLEIDAQITDSMQALVEVDNGRGAWALWSHYAFNGGYLNTARSYAWRAIIAEPLAPSSWKAIIRSYVRNPRSRVTLLVDRWIATG
jgi:glycosyltransferase involved in cell wall biosynthesis